MSEEQRQEELRREIERTRQELGDTVEALSHKADVKAQVQEKKEEGAQVHEKAERAKSQASEGRARQAQVQEKAAHAKQRMPIAPAVAGIAVAVVALWLIKRR